MSSKKDIAEAVQVVAAIAETIREVGEVPSGTLYAGLMAKGCTFPQYEKILGVLVRSGLVRVKNHLVTWIGPLKGEIKGAR